MISSPPSNGASNLEFIAWDTLNVLLGSGAPLTSYMPLPGQSNLDFIMWDILQNIGSGGGGGGGGISFIESSDGSINVNQLGSFVDLTFGLRLNFWPLDGTNSIAPNSTYKTNSTVGNPFITFAEDQLQFTTEGMGTGIGDVSSVLVRPDRVVLISSNSTQQTGLLVDPDAIRLELVPLQGLGLSRSGPNMAFGVFNKYISGRTQAPAIPDASNLATAISSLNTLLLNMRQYGFIAE